MRSCPRLSFERELHEHDDSPESVVSDDGGQAEKCANHAYSLANAHFAHVSTMEKLGSRCSNPPQLVARKVRDRRDVLGEPAHPASRQAVVQVCNLTALPPRFEVPAWFRPRPSSRPDEVDVAPARCEAVGMRTTLLLTAVGTDRTGLVESLAQRIAAVGGNWEESRLARLGGQFAGIVLVTIDDAKTDALIAKLRELESAGLQVTSRVVPATATVPTGTRVRLTVTGNDRAGIVRDVSRVLADRAVNVEELESSVGSAPMSGEAMFVARARLLVPPSLELATLRTALESLGNELMVDLTAD